MVLKRGVPWRMPSLKLRETWRPLFNSKFEQTSYLLRDVR
jgi:hypothetical protein